MSHKIPLAIHSKAILIESPGLATVIKVDNNQIALTPELARDIARQILTEAPRKDIMEPKSPYVM